MQKRLILALSSAVAILAACGSPPSPTQGSDGNPGQTFANPQEAEPKGLKIPEVPGRDGVSAMNFGANLIVNGQFTSNLNSWQNFGGTASSMTMVAGRTGAGNAVQGRNWVWIQQGVPVTGGRVYRLTLWARNNGGQYPCTVGFRGGPASGETFRESMLFPSSAWEQKSITVTIPQDATWGAVFLQDGGLGSSNNGNCQFDDAELLEEIPPQPNAQNIVINGEFDTNFNYWANQGSGSTATIVAGRAGAGNAVRTQNNGWLQQNMTLAFFREYRVTAWARATDPAKACIVGVRGGPTGSENFRQQMTFTSTTWVQQTFIVGVSSNATWAAAYLADNQAACEFDSVSITDARNVTDAGEIPVTTVQPATNLIRDPGFARVSGTSGPAINYAAFPTRPSDWTFRPATSLTLVSTPGGNTPDRTGNPDSYAMSMTIGWLYQSLNLPGTSAGRTYRFTAWVRRDGLSNCNLEVYGLGDTSQPGWGSVIQSQTVTNTAWEQKTIDFVVPNGTSPAVTVMLREDFRTPNTFYLTDKCMIDDVMLVDIVGATQTVQPAADPTTNFSNPERGFRVGTQMGLTNNAPLPCDYDTATNAPGRTPESAANETSLARTDSGGWNAEVLDYKNRGYTVIKAYVSLRPWKNQAIPSWYITELRDRLTTVRNAGLKVHIRFWYNWDRVTGWDAANNREAIICLERDAPMSTIRTHLGSTQLAPLFTDFADVIMTVQAGFLGAYGEWAYSTLGQTPVYNVAGYSGYVNTATDPNQAVAWRDARTELITLLRGLVPSDRKIQVRYAGALRLFISGPITQAQATTDPVLSRLAFHNDAFMANQADAGTYAWDNPQRDLDRALVMSFTPYGPVGGEFAGDIVPSGTDVYNRRAGTQWGIIQEFERFNWSWLAEDYGQQLIDELKSTGTAQNPVVPSWPSIQRRLGYRLTLTSLTAPVEMSRTGRFNNFGFTIANTGFAAPFNPKVVRVVLRNIVSGQRFVIPVSNQDTRNWIPTYRTPSNTTVYDPTIAQATKFTVAVDEPMPVGITSGEYEVLIAVVDNRRPDDVNYAIRFANVNAWETSNNVPTGANRTGMTLRIQ